MSTFGRETTAEEVVQRFADQIAGRTVVITGASSKSLAAQTALELAKANTPPRKIILLARSVSKVQPVLDAIASINGSIESDFVSISLDSFDSVRRAAEETLSKLGSAGKVDLLLNSAGIMAVPYSKSQEGIESQFAVNHVGHFLFTKLLSPAVQAAGPEARIINLSSCGYAVCPFRPEDYNFSDGNTYEEWSGYGASKTANILFTKGLALGGLTSFAVHPGTIMGTGLSEDLDMSLFDTIDEVSRKNTGESFRIDPPKSIEQGAATILVAALDPGLVSQSGNYLADCEIQDVKSFAKDSEMVKKLWALSEQLVGEKFGM